MIDDEVKREIDKFIEAENRLKYSEAFTTIFAEGKGHPSFTGPAAELWAEIFDAPSQIRVLGKGEFAPLCITSTESILQLAKQIKDGKEKQRMSNSNDQMELPGVQNYDEPLPAETMKFYEQSTETTVSTRGESMETPPGYGELTTPTNSAAKMKRPDLVQEIEDTYTAFPDLVRSSPNKGRWVYEDKKTLVEEVVRLRESTNRLLPSDTNPAEAAPTRKQVMQEAKAQFCQTMDGLLLVQPESNLREMIETMYNWVKTL